MIDEEDSIPWTIVNWYNNSDEAMKAASRLTRPWKVIKKKNTSIHRLYRLDLPEAKFEDIVPGTKLVVYTKYKLNSFEVLTCKTEPVLANKDFNFWRFNASVRGDSGLPLTMCYCGDYGIQVPDSEKRDSVRKTLLLSKPGAEVQPTTEPINDMYDEAARKRIVDFKKVYDKDFKILDVKELTSQITQELLKGASPNLAHGANPNPQPQVINMNDASYNALLLMAQGEAMPSVPGFEMASDGIKASIKKKLDAAREAAQDEAAEYIVELYKRADQDAKRRALEVRDLKRRIQAHKMQGEERDRAMAYGVETDNYLPLAAILRGLPWANDEDERALRVVPKDWKPSKIEG